MLDDHNLQQRLIEGEEEAYDAVFRAWYAPLVRFVRAMLREHDEAEEIVQEVMLELWNKRTQLDPEQPVQGWLFRAARNRALNVLRHQRVRSSATDTIIQLAGSSTPTDDATTAHELGAAIHEVFALLPPRCREVFQLSRGEGLRNAEIAERLGISVKGVEAQMAKALRTFREELRPWLSSGKEL